MATWGVLVVRLREHPDCGELNRWRRDFLNQFDPDEISCDGPLTISRDAGHGPVPVDDGSTWLDVGLTLSYYGKGYERGDPEHFVRIAEWLERRIPDCEVWYGHDSDDESIEPFGPAERTALLEYFRRVGHEPYKRGR
jgi:hypothetical protein